MERMRLDISKQTIYVSWYSPQHGWMCLNIDDYTKMNRQVVDCGGVIADSNVRWIVGGHYKGTCLLSWKT